MGVFVKIVFSRFPSGPDPPVSVPAAVFSGFIRLNRTKKISDPPDPGRSVLNGRHTERPPPYLSSPADPGRRAPSGYTPPGRESLSGIQAGPAGGKAGIL